MSVSGCDVFSDTIAAIATPLGGGVSIIRISGTGAVAIGAALFSRIPNTIEDRRVYYGIAAFHGERLDECLYFVMKAPRSYTREDVAEVHCHGGAATAGAVLSAVLALGARLAEPGEFTKRAYLSGRVDLSQAEAVMELIAAGGERARKAALSRLSGEIFRKAREFQTIATEILSKISAGIDFPDEVGEADIAPDLKALSESLDEWAKTAKAGEATQNGLRLAIVGRPNVGKSTLMNILCGVDVSIVTPSPGTTRDVLRHMAAFGGVSVIFGDTAGVRFAGEDGELPEVENIGVERALSEAAAADIVLFVTDGEFAPLGDDAPIVDNIGDTPVIAVVNKSDLGAKPCDALLSRFNTVALVSAKTGEGIDELQKLIAAIVTRFAPDCGGIMASKRQLAALTAANAAAAAAYAAAKRGLPQDLLAIDIEDVRLFLGEITGETATDAVIDKVFADFCVGK